MTCIYQLMGILKLKKPHVISYSFFTMELYENIMTPILIKHITSKGH